MTEIPEHLLKRSQERRAALSGEAAPAGAADAPQATPAGTAVTPAPAAKAAAPAAAPAAPPPPKPDPPYVESYKKRKKVPVWAMMTLCLLPLWAFMYVRSLTPEPLVVHGPLGDGAKIFTGSCSSCHAADGSGGAGRQLSDGEVLKTFPHIEDQLNLVYTGSQAFGLAGLPYYGDAARAHLGYNGAFMPAQGAKNGGALTEAEILAVVCEERYGISGADPEGADYATEYTKWCAEDSAIYAGLKDGSITFDNITTTAAGTGVLPIGTDPRPATPKS